MKLLGKFIFILFLFILLMVLFFFVPFPQFAQFDKSEPINFFVYSKGRVSRKITFTPGSELHEKLNSWLNNNTFGWHHSFITYGGNIMIYSKDASLFIDDGVAVLNYDSHCLPIKRHTQVVQKMNTKQLTAELLKLSSTIRAVPVEMNNKL